MTHPTLLTAALCLAAAPLAAADLSAFDALLGVWQGKGVLRGAPMEAEYRWERDLGRKFVRLRYRVLAAGKTVFEGEARYRAGGGHWFDSNGSAYDIAWEALPGGVASEWGPAGAFYGKSRYEVGSQGVLTVTDWAKGKTGTLAEFAKFEVRRAPGLALTRVTVATGKMPEMVRYYEAVFGVRFEAVALGDATGHRGVLAGFELLLCPNSVAKVKAEQNRKQLSLQADDLDELRRRVGAAGAAVLHESAEGFAVRDPDGNTVELLRRPR